MKIRGDIKPLYSYWWYNYKRRKFKVYIREYYMEMAQANGYKDRRPRRRLIDKIKQEELRWQ